MQINIDCKGYFGVRILRHQNEGKRLIKIPSSLLATRKYYINLQNPMDIWRNQVIVLNMLFKTTRKLILVNGGQSEEGEWEYHKWRFESYIPELEWMLTDMDDSLKGNDYRIMNNIKND